MGSKKALSKLLHVMLGLLLVVGVLSGCTGNSSEETPQRADGTFNAGTYTGEAEGKDGKIKVEVTVNEDSRIADIKIVSQSETGGLGDAALEKVKDQIIADQSLAVDAVSGASLSSKAMVIAVENAMKQAGGDIKILKTSIKKAGEGKTERLTTDVIVVGAGASGVSAAVSAADTGAKVIIIEKTANIGGASNLSWAGKFYNSTEAVSQGVKIEVEKEITDWIVNNHWRVDAAAIRQYVMKSGQTYEWLNEKGYVTKFLNFGGEQLHVLPPYESRQATLRKMLTGSVEKNGGQVLTETTAKKLLTNAEGVVTGVQAVKSDGTTLEISAQSVIMATGGYAANKEMVKKSFGFEGVNGGLGQNVGEGLEMAWAVGAKVPDNFGGQMLHQTLARATEKLKKQYTPFEASYPLMLTYLPNFMNVGSAGARFRDEAATLTPVAAANTSAFNGAYHLVIVSKAQLDALMNKGLSGIHAPKLPGMPPEFYANFKGQFKLDTPWNNAEKVFESMVANGDGFKGNTIEELAKNAGMDEATFKEAYEQYQDAIQTGVDTAFGKDKAYLTPMEQKGPYYAIIAEINNLGSVGGLLVNTKFQVLNDQRVPVKGLYAVGLESEGVLYNDTYVGNGVGIGYAFTSGRLGGESAAKGIVQGK
jgi:fumarate reductase flavoprotein subunit